MSKQLMENDSFYAAVPAAADVDAELGSFYDAVPAAAELKQGETGFDPDEAVLDLRAFALDQLGVVYEDLGQQKLVTRCGTGSSNGCDLDGE